MKTIILKIFGIDLDFYKEVKKYNAYKQREAEIAEFKKCEDKIINAIGPYDKKTVDRVLYCTRHLTKEGLPMERYKELSDKYRLYDELAYKMI